MVQDTTRDAVAGTETLLGKVGSSGKVPARPG